jgi:four helix bundle protein
MLCRALPESREGRLIGNQIFRSGTAAGANYGAACRGRSKADFNPKLGIALEEADESLYWLEVLCETEIVEPELLKPLITEAAELVAILVASVNTIVSTNTRITRTSRSPNLKSQISNR